tara:strand:+ start:252 stop:530 length:279 start_codon:yes stop_codon:yes gene_type:complete
MADNRYKNTEKIKKENNQVYYRSTYFDNIPITDSDMYIISQYGDRLDLLAHQFYGDVTLWWYIARANNLFAMNIPEGLQMRIPGSLKYAQGT